MLPKRARLIGHVSRTWGRVCGMLLMTTLVVEPQIHLALWMAVQFQRESEAARRGGSRTGAARAPAARVFSELYSFLLLPFLLDQLIYHITKMIYKVDMSSM
jgi:hypothetical protein